MPSRTTIEEQEHVETKAEHKLSKRGWSNVEAIMPKIKGAVSERMSRTTSNIDLSTAENWLLRPELLHICRDAIRSRLEEKHFSYPRGFSGDPDLLDAFCGLFNEYFCPTSLVEPGQLAVAPGAMAAIDALLYNICEPGDGVIVPGPYWNGFDFGMRVRSSVTPVVASMTSFEANFNETSLAEALEKAYQEAPCPIKALMITNPHNPLSLCYSKSLLAICAQFCENHDIHFISDEVYALSVFKSPDLPNAQRFVSALSLDLDSLNVDKSKVHVVWSTSKDFGQSGMRMGVTITQNNQEMAVAVALAAQMQVSNLTATFVTTLLTSPKLRDLIALNAERLSVSYSAMTRLFKKFDIPYIPCNAGLYVFAKLAPMALTWQDEQVMVSQMKEVGVLVSAGKSYSGPESEKGWARVGFAVVPGELDEAIRRMSKVLAETKKIKVVRRSSVQVHDEVGFMQEKKRRFSIQEAGVFEGAHKPVKRAKVF